MLEYKKPLKKKTPLKEDTMVKKVSVKDPSKEKQVVIRETTETLDDVMRELNELTGLDGVKNEVKTLINYVKIQQERKKVGLKIIKNSYHCIFTGSSGTGKTTIARIIGKVYKNLGILKKGHFIETDRSGLVSKYVGQTAAKVNEIIDSALDGVLYIDEAYSLIGRKEMYGEEALATLIKRMEDDRERLVVILSGYTEEMKAFMDSNPGLKSRFNRYIDFVDYNPKELLAIFKYQCNKLDEKAEAKLIDVIGASFSQKDKSFGNGRFIRNVFEKCIEKQSNRIADNGQLHKWLPFLNKEKLITIVDEDIPCEHSKIDTNYLV